MCLFFSGLFYPVVTSAVCLTPLLINFSQSGYPPAAEAVLKEKVLPLKLVETTLSVLLVLLML